MTVDFKKLLRDTIRACFIDSDDIPIPIGGPLSPGDYEDGELCDVLSDGELQAFAELVRDVKAEAVAAGESRNLVINDIDRVIAECLG